jgi:lysophospholipase L1-like esterase
MKIKLLILFLGISFTTSLRAQQGFPFDNEIRVFKHQDSLSFPAKNSILFIGSSSIRKWTDLEQRFIGKSVIKRGVGGCTLEQLVDYYTPYILFPYHPKKVFIYAGENDIAAGKSGQFVFEEFEKLWVMINKELPGASIYFMSIKLSPSRAQYFNEVVKANSLIKSYMLGKSNSKFIDVGTVILKPNSTDPDPSLFQSDMLHLNSKGYDRWQQVLEPFVN